MPRDVNPSNLNFEGNAQIFLLGFFTSSPLIPWAPFSALRDYEKA